MLLLQPQPVTSPRPKWPFPHLNLAIYYPTVWTPCPLTSPPPPSSAMPAWRQIACQWWKEQLLKARRKWELQRKSWCSNTSEGKRDATSSDARIHAEASVPFVAPTPKCARLMETIISNVECCSTSVSAPPSPSSPPCLTSSATYPQPWGEFAKWTKNPTPMTPLHRPRKWRRIEDQEWKELRKDRCEVHDKAGTDEHRGRGGSRG